MGRIDVESKIEDMSYNTGKLLGHLVSDSVVIQLVEEGMTTEEIDGLKKALVVFAKKIVYKIE